MDASSGRDRLVMGLSIAALLLFVANLITMVQHHFFDDSAEQLVEVIEHEHAHEFIVASPHSEHSFQIRINGDSDDSFILQTQKMGLEHDMIQLRLDMERMARDLERDFQDLDLGDVEIEFDVQDLERLEDIQIQVESENQAVMDAVEATREALRESAQAADTGRKKRRIVVRSDGS